MQHIANNKTFWKLVKSYLTDKTRTGNDMNWNEGRGFVENGQKCANIFNKIFLVSLKSLLLEMTPKIQRNLVKYES